MNQALIGQLLDYTGSRREGHKKIWPLFAPKFIH
jgi:hypothetical protein